MHRVLATSLLILGTIAGVTRAPLAHGQTILYANGFNPSPGPTQYQGIWDLASGGSGGANLSQLIAPNTTFGFTQSATAGFALADDFVVPIGPSWTINRILLYTYQTGQVAFPFTTANVGLTSGTANGATLFSEAGIAVTQGAGGQVAFRALSTDPTSTARRIFEIQVDLTSPWTIGAGTYWLNWSTVVANAGAHFTAPIVPTNGGGNAAQSSGGPFAGLTDSGSGLPVELPFALVNTSAVPEPSQLALAGMILAIGAVARRFRRARA